MNLDLDKNQFMTCLIVNVEKVGKVMNILREDATHMEVVYINKTPGKVKSGKIKLMNRRNWVIVLVNLHVTVSHV